MLRARLKSVVKRDPENVRLISEAASTLVRLMRANFKLGFNKAEDFEKARLKVLFSLGPQFGLDVNKLVAGYFGKFHSGDKDIRFPPK